MAKEIDNKKALAQLLYVENGLTRREVSDMVGVAETTITNWSEKGNWKTLRVSVIGSRQKTIERLYAALNDVLTIAESEGRITTQQEAKLITQLTAAISNIDRTQDIAFYVSVLREFLQFIRPLDLSLTQNIAEYINSFIQKKIREIKTSG
ncbi:MAG: hypothetical protein IPI59_15605 [Sphingobacteriales bacterium]|jgi:DNA-binding XRE family transcriptional regulator|nr:hypothetical protein [Sphingobacteriales bacterium]MBP6663908.1 hypothetical protein [Chitinophagales bacterium]MDA0199688.1 hypothetical protein [Bacteroidota bacterium]MBK6888570.1 hypothetical protein [Sphingobacteriales bacterium]MBK7528922.1 hypothetical protein [Sphingobacteriales bacterium]